MCLICSSLFLALKSTSSLSAHWPDIPISTVRMFNPMTDSFTNIQTGTLPVTPPTTEPPNLDCPPIPVSLLQLLLLSCTNFCKLNLINVVYIDNINLICSSHYEMSLALCLAMMALLIQTKNCLDWCLKVYQIITLLLDAAYINWHLLIQFTHSHKELTIKRGSIVIII